MKTRVVFWANLALGAALLALMLRSYGGPALAVLRSAPSALDAALFAAVAVASIGCLAYRWGVLLGGLSPPPALATLTLQRSAAHSLAVLIPSGKVGGDPLRAWLAARAGVPAADAIASVAVDRSVEIACSTLFSMIFAGLLLRHGVSEIDSALTTIVLGAFGLGVGLWIAVRRLRRGAGLVSSLVRRMSAARWRFVTSQLAVIEAAERAMAALTAQPRRALAALGLGVLANLLVIAEFALLLRAFALPLEPATVAAAIFASGAAHMLPIPAGVGVLEGAQIWIFGLLGYPLEVGLAVGLAVRLREILWMAPGLLYLLSRPFADAAELRVA